ncbi:ABC transporter permease subunit [Sphingomonas sp. HITSZ_GF]|uniref:ABC transporter permease subunit n=1 Tax=Sphingomonas sp. HITSZ_GF TaxID=3037247 RepID=UPI00240E4EE0|nr:ABC transporter permease subunit [Sphingomonas sp. HITSZ_GF]MDG2535518.1 ABC transporter permease subunit [Sphingomonas sp. HITSZ_GF]
MPSRFGLPKAIGAIVDSTALISGAGAATIWLVAFFQAPLAWLFSFFFDARVSRLLAEGTMTTIEVGVCSIALGTALGFLFAYGLRGVSRGRGPLARYFTYALLYIGLAAPVYVLLVMLGPFFRSEFVGALVILSLNLSFFVAKLVLGAFEAVPTAQLDAAIVTGARGLRLWWHFERPALWRICGAGIVNEWATTLKLSSLVGVIGVVDIMNAAKAELLQSMSLLALLVVVFIYALLIVPVCVLADQIAKSA